MATRPTIACERMIPTIRSLGHNGQAHEKKGFRVSPEAPGISGGAERDRTVGLLNAIQALSQLSYSPTICKKERYNNRRPKSTRFLRRPRPEGAPRGPPANGA